jgi:putative sterol carrier protein
VVGLLRGSQLRAEEYDGYPSGVAAAAQEFFDGLEYRFHADRAAGLDCIYQFEITGDDGGAWHADISGGSCTVTPGVSTSPDITITCGASDWMKIVEGKLNPQMAFMTGKLKVKGDMGLALRLQSLFL